MSSANQGDRFIEVTRGGKKRKASNSPTLPSQPKPGSSQPPLKTPVRPKTLMKNTISVIISGVDEKFKSWKKLSGELRQYHPVSKFPGDFVIIGDTLQDVIILQNEKKWMQHRAEMLRLVFPKPSKSTKIIQKVLQ